MSFGWVPREENEEYDRLSKAVSIERGVQLRIQPLGRGLHFIWPRGTESQNPSLAPFPISSGGEGHGRWPGGWCRIDRAVEVSAPGVQAQLVRAHLSDISAVLEKKASASHFNAALRQASSATLDTITTLIILGNSTFSVRMTSKPPSGAGQGP